MIKNPFHPDLDLEEAAMEEPTTHTASTTTTGLSDSGDGPPADDCCPICFGAFSTPFRGPCGHWYCGGCIIEYWNHVAPFKPCNCPMCSRPITKLTPESTLYQQHADQEIIKNVKQYNCLFVGGACGFILQLLQLPLFIKRLIQAMMDPDRPVAYLSRLRLVAVLLGALYTLSPLDFLPRWRYLDAIDLFDCSAIALSFSLYFVGLYSRRRRLRRLGQLAQVPLVEVVDM